MKRTYRKIHFAEVQNNISEGETMLTKVRRILNDKEPITDGADIIYTEKKDGVRPEFDIRTDRWEVAQRAMDKVAAAKIAKSKQQGEPQKKEETKNQEPPKPATES